MYSPIGNIKMLLALQDEGLLPTYLLVLAHEVVQYPEEYKHISRGGNFPGTLILDNSLIELGKPADPSIMLKAADIIQPDFVVLPDILSDAERTLAETQKALLDWVPSLPRKSGFMIVAQGKDQIEITKCAETLFLAVKPYLLDKGINQPPMIGLPRVHTNMGIKRSTLTPLIKLQAPIHLLGMSDDFGDDMRCFHQRQVTGIDSATPIRCGYEDIKYNLNGHTRAPMVHREKFFNDCKEVSSAMIYNIGFINGVIETARRGI